MKLGVLALQGDYAAHGRALVEASALAAVGATVTWVRRPADLEGLSGLVLPGGESTTLLNLLAQDGLDDAIAAFSRAGGVVFGTCAGAILISCTVRSPEQRSLGLLDAVIERNAYGRQVDSFVGEAVLTAAGVVALGPGGVPAVFIRAPRFLEVGAGVEVLATQGEDPVLVRQGNVLASTFHPELTDDRRVHALFVAEAAKSAGAASARSSVGGELRPVG